MSARDEPPPGAYTRRPAWRSAVRSIVPAVALLALIVGGLWYWQNRSESSSDSPYGPVPLPEARNATDRSPAPEEGRAGPDFVLERLGGGQLRLSDLQGSPVLLNFWASWCPPCKNEMPDIVDQYERYKGQGLVVVAVNLQEADSKVSDFAAEYGMDFPIVIDRAGAVAGAWRIGGAFEGLPSSYFIDASGVVRAVFNRELTPDLIDQGLALILPGAGA
jgi:cytochrome c biogenesis protein CcmG/thiol:disulfide interchange protein DsbE